MKPAPPNASDGRNHKRDPARHIPGVDFVFMRMLARQIGAADGDRPAKPFERLPSAIALPDSRLEEARLAGTARVTLVRVRCKWASMKSSRPRRNEGIDICRRPIIRRRTAPSWGKPGAFLRRHRRGKRWHIWKTFQPANCSSGAGHACARIYRQKSLNRSGDSSV